MIVVNLTETAAAPQVPGPGTGSNQGRKVRVFGVTVANDGTSGTAGRVIIENDAGSAACAGAGTEVLANGALTSGTSWSRANDFALGSDKATYTHSAGSGTLTQASNVFAVTLKPFTRYRFTYTVSGKSGSPAATITTGVATAATSLTLTNGTQTTDFTTNGAPGNFVVSGTSAGAAAFSLDNLSLVQIADTYVNVPDPGTQHGSWVYMFDTPLEIPHPLGLNVRIVLSDHVNVSVMYE